MMPVQVIDRAVRLLRVVARSGPASLTDLSREASLALPTTARIVGSLVENGFLQRVGARKYQLGARLLSLSTPLEPFRKSIEVVHPYVAELCSRTHEDCGFAVLQGNEALVIDWCYGPHGDRIIEPYSREIPLHCAFGKVLIAFQPAAWRARFLQRTTLKKMARGTVANKAALAEEIQQIRRSGLHNSIAENVDGAGSLTVPVFDEMSRLLGALFVTGPLERFGEREKKGFQVALFDVSERLSAQMRAKRRASARGT
jgi:DNA-binding IclR family transcriptional regulator